MKRIVLFFGVMVGALVAFVVASLWYLSSYQSNGTVQGMMAQMMGGSYPGNLALPMPSWVWVSLVALIAVAAVAVVGVGYYSAFPEIVNHREPVQSQEDVKGDPSMDWSVLMKTSKPDEKKVLSILAAHNGKYLQKFVVKESGLSRLKTHRIVSRFAERGVITVQKSGNTNELALAGWLQDDVTSSVSAR